MEKYAECEKYTQPLSSALAKITTNGKECAAFGCSNIFYDSEGTTTGINFFKFPLLLLEIYRWCNLIMRQNNKDGVLFPRILFYVITDIKKSFSRWKLLPGSVPS